MIVDFEEATFDLSKWLEAAEHVEWRAPVASLNYLLSSHVWHGRGFKENGTTTTAFDMVMLNDLDRYHLVTDVIDRVPGLGPRAAPLRQTMTDARLAARDWTRVHGDDIPDVANWTWRGDPRAEPVERVP